MKLFTKLKNNTCPNCLNNSLVLYEYSSNGTMKVLNDEGYVKNDKIITNNFINKLYCTNCKSEYEVEKQGMTYKIKSNLPKIPVIYKTKNPFQE